MSKFFKKSSQQNESICLCLNCDTQKNKKKKGIIIAVMSIVLTIALNISGCTNANNIENTTITPEKAVDIYMANKDKWMLDSSYSSTGDSSYGFLDLDFDGTLELVVNSISGTGIYSENTYYKINQETKTVATIAKNTPENKNGEYDFNYSLYPKLLKNNTSGEMFYYCYDFLRVSTGDSYVTLGTLKLNNDEVKAEYLFQERNCDTSIEGNEDLVNEYWYYENGNAIETDKNTYKSMHVDYFAQHTNLYLTWETINGSDFDSADDTAQKTLLLNSYNKFNYDGYKENTYEDDGTGPSVIGALKEDFILSSGASAWGTTVTIKSDGNFTVNYHDSEMSLVEDDYPKGTVYKADAIGKFYDIKRINDYTYSMKMSDLEYQNQPGTEEIVNGINYIYSTAYGLDEAKRVYLYTPEAPISELPIEFLNWAHITKEPLDNATLGFYVLYNVDEQTGFTSNNK